MRADGATFIAGAKIGPKAASGDLKAVAASSNRWFAPTCAAA
jgi:hypothetical protein